MRDDKTAFGGCGFFGGFLRRVAVAAAVLAVCAPAGAEGVGRGALLSFSCAACHAPAAATGNGGIPSLEGRGAGFIAAALRDFQSGASESTVMGRIAKGYDDDEIDAIAAYLGRKAQ